LRTTEFDIFKKIILKRFRPTLKYLDINKDFIEVSTDYDNKHYVVRLEGVQDVTGRRLWKVVRVINNSIIPSELNIK